MSDIATQPDDILMTEFEASEKEKWDAYVKENRVNEIAMNSWGRSKFGGSTPVVSFWFSTDRLCLLWRRKSN